jgi:Putative Ig domain
VIFSRSQGLVTAVFAAALGAGCGNDTAPPTIHDNHPPSVRSAGIVPNPIVLNTAVRVEVQGEDPDQDPLTFRVRWFADDRLLEGQSGTSLDPASLKRGMRVRADITALDSKAESGVYRTDLVPVGNTPPEIRSVVPDISAPKPGDRLRLKIESSDADGDEVHFTYRWWKNTSLVLEGENQELDTMGYSRGDTVVAEVTPNDSSGPGRPLMSAPIVIGNSPPSLTSSPTGLVSQGLYEYTVTAVDNDGDHLSFTLESAPPGMNIDPTSGRIQWEVPLGISGSHRVKVVVQDGQGGHAYQEFSLSVPGRTGS